MFDMEASLQSGPGDPGTVRVPNRASRAIETQEVNPGNPCAGAQHGMQHQPTGEKRGGWRPAQRRRAWGMRHPADNPSPCPPAARNAAAARAAAPARRLPRHHPRAARLRRAAAADRASLAAALARRVLRHPVRHGARGDGAAAQLPRRASAGDAGRAGLPPGLRQLRRADRVLGGGGGRRRAVRHGGDADHPFAGRRQPARGLRRAGRPGLPGRAAAAGPGDAVRRGLPW